MKKVEIETKLAERKVGKMYCINIAARKDKDHVEHDTLFCEKVPTEADVKEWCKEIKCDILCVVIGELDIYTDEQQKDLAFKVDYVPEVENE